MVNWQSATTVALDSLAEVKVAHLIIGVYLWDWFLGLPYEYRLLKRRDAWRWPMFVYLACRMSAFAVVVISLVVFNMVGEENCDVSTRVCVIFANIALALSSALIAIRTVAIWQRHRIATLVVLILWTTNIAFLIHSATVDPQVYWDSERQSCGTYINDLISRPNVWVSFAVDLALITTMIVGLWTFKGAGCLGRLVFNQGVIWCIVATVCYIPPVVLLGLNINPPLNMVTQTPTCVIMVLCTTMMHRQLAQHTNPITVPSLPISQSIEFACCPAPSEKQEISEAHFDITTVPPARLPVTKQSASSVMRSEIYSDNYDSTGKRTLISMV